MSSEYPITLRSGQATVERIVSAAANTADLLAQETDHVIVRASPVYKNESGMYGWVEFARRQALPGDRLANNILSAMPAELRPADGILQSGTKITIDMLIGIIEVPSSLIESLKVGKRRNAGKDKVFANTFKIDYSKPEDLSMPQFQGIPFTEDKYYVCYHPSYQPANISSPEAFIQQTHTALRVTVGYLFRMHEWAMHANSQNWNRTRLEYSEMARRPLPGKEHLLLLE